MENNYKRFINKQKFLTGRYKHDGLGNLLQMKIKWLYFL